MFRLIKQRLLPHPRLLWLSTVMMAGVLSSALVGLMETHWLGQINTSSVLSAIVIAGLLGFLLCSRVQSVQSLREPQTVLNHAERLAHVGAWSYVVSSDEFRP